ncbi:hypothetical protein KC363_g4550 [Hortaea werneckii]|uniref:F-box domain-containing protein n=1 Tax=Hortaea werneckii TaxID=91943 RepID=A0A3M7G1V3_HORWE|nr:hypothetical protein KC361_g5315 [Hortaea werneckii]KAI6883530.1 hypothetical protein KC325_g4999 [Hortaea werneckii]KAI6992485.1 hypothetical protein KC359_g5686 [Hortaea werneckii]KAI7144982.1 hypothetical protein KC344_g4925 [Hortaea werneckii]KAI7173382.1 hypothetical protein KC360_g4952 [Hortaea werneckii]
MGRHEYLSRLALGRSPFENIESSNDGFYMQAENGEFSEPEGNAQSVNEAQQYNAKGRPINPTTDLRNAEMRKAQNSVLELVGVVERRERSEYSNEMKFRYIHHARQTVLAAEHETGEGIESLIQLLVAPLTTWWSDCLIQRCLIGLYTAKEPFASVVSGMWQTLRTGGLKGTYSILFPGLVPYVAYVIARMCSEALAEDVIRRMSERVLRQVLPIRQRKRMLHVLELVEAGLRLLIDGSLLPLLYYATAQQIGVAPALPLLPPLGYHLPWSPYSFHAFGWKPLLGLPLLRSVSSPAALILGQTLLHIESEEGIISSTDLTNFRRPSFGELPEVPKTPTIKDPLGWILFQTYRLRRKAVEWCGWTIVPSSNVQNLNTKHETDVLVGNEDGTDGSVRRHRSTALARLPAQHLAAHIDSFLERLVLLPFECLVLRAVAVSYSNSPLPKTLEALAATPMLPRPFAGWMDQALHSHSAITSTSAQINKVGLALILRLAMGTLLCTGVAKGICWFGYLLASSTFAAVSPLFVSAYPRLFLRRLLPALEAVATPTSRERDHLALNSHVGDSVADRMNRVQEGLQREGKSCYRRGDYKTAIGHFDRAIGRAPSVQLLDNRAACHEKLNDLPAALKDAKRAIQFQNEDPTGYLRAGKVLVKMDKQSVALEIYAHGLKKVKHIGQGYELLRKTHSELTTQLAPPTSIDPLTVLPRELAELILGYLSFQQRIAISRVSKQWMGFIRSSPNLWQHLDLSNPKRKVKTAFISKAINTARQKLTSATLSSLHDFDKVLHALLRHCPIEHLTLCDTGLQSQNLVEALKKSKHLKSLRLDRGTEIGPTTLAQVIQVCASTLETFQCTLARNEEFLGIWTKCERLSTLKITLTGDTSRIRPGIAAQNAPVAPVFGGALLPNLHEFTPNLQSITIHDKKPRSQLYSVLDLCSLEGLEWLDLELPIESAHQLMLPSKLVHLRFVSTINNATANFFKDSDGSVRGFSLPQLQSLEVAVPWMDIALIDLFLTGDPESRPAAPTETPVAPSKLKQLNLHTLSVSSVDLTTFLSHPRLEQLSEFGLRPSSVCDDNITEVIIDKLPRLHTVDVSGTDITGVGVKKLLRNSNLKTLVVNDCRYLGSDAVAWAREHGVKVAYKMSSSETGGKKVRY